MFKIYLFYASIPKNEELNKEWLNSIRAVDSLFVPSKFSKICNLHFEDSDYTLSVVGEKKVLKKQAVPSIFVPSSK